MAYFFLLFHTAYAQQTIIKGVIKDAQTGETLPFATVTVPGTKIGASADIDGRYNLRMDGDHRSIQIAYIGYVSQEIPVKPGESQTINVQLEVNATMLNEVVVTGTKARYRNRDNPAVQLIRQVIAHKDSNRMGAHEYEEFKQYEKVSLALSNISDRFRNNKIFKNYQFLFQEQDSTALGGKTILPAFMTEKLTQVYYRKHPEKKKEILLGEKKAEFDKQFLDDEGMKDYINRLYENIDIYENNVTLAANQFLSPIAGTSPTFYKFYITDTIKTQQPYLVELSFVPRNRADKLFQGKIYITLDGNYAVQHAVLSLDNNVNLNFLRNMEATLSFEKSEDGRYRLSNSVLEMEFSLSEKGSGLYGRRVTEINEYAVNQPRPDSIYQGPRLERRELELAHSENGWNSLRPIPLEGMEQDIYRNVDTLQRIPSFRRTMDIATLLLAGYKSFGIFEVGPVNTFYSFNPIEGFRLRFGGRTTPNLSKRFYMETYAAYGFRDQRWKYFLSGTYSFNNQSIYHFPLHYLRVSYQNDTKVPGQELQFVQDDNFLLSFRRGENDRWLYNKLFKLEYVKEFENRFSYKVGFSRWQQEPAGVLAFQRQVAGQGLENIRYLNNSELSMELRYAPNEKFYQGKLYRIPIINEHPIFTLRYAAGIKGLFNGDNAYHHLSAAVFKRSYLSQFGFIDWTLDGGYIFGEQIPFPLLSLPRANQTYAYQLNSYNLMNFMEFANDRYANLNMQYYMNGFLFNKVPLLRRLKWREVFSFKALFGGLRDGNNPNIDASNMLFPTDVDGQAVTYVMGSEPYMEASAGITNIFKILRVDAVRRLNYMDLPNAPKWGIRFRVKFDF